LEELEARLITSGTVAIKHGGREIRYVGAFPLKLGREPLCEVVLRDVGISREHVELSRDGERFAVRDLDSRNGTTLQSVRIAASSALPRAGGSGEIGVGQNCAIRYDVAGDSLRLDVVRGLDRGLVVLASVRPMAIERVAELMFKTGGRGCARRGKGA